jgi:hypothetical protein
MADIGSFSSQCLHGLIRDTLHAGTRQAINNHHQQRCSYSRKIAGLSGGVS